MNLWLYHPAVPTGDDLSRGERIADASVKAMGSWPFMLIQAGLMVVWALVNVLALFVFDRFPFILLNLALSTEAAFAAPLILLSQRRSDARNAAVALHTMNIADEIHTKLDVLLDRTDAAT